MPKISTCLWFGSNGVEAAEYYTSLFDDSEITQIMVDPGGNPHTTEGEDLVVHFRLQDQEFQIINGGPMFQLDEAVSIVLECETQEEADRYYTELAREGSEQPCGWVRDKFGLSWQIVPAEVNRLYMHPDRAVARRAVEAMLTMTRLDSVAMRKAALGQ
ncbi:MULTISPECIES: VOC family protein [Kocuria]|uniref:VOC family protein n=1 Tax=Kocuria subflava TaxID=1736139 RepID=A0A846TUA6_9MICC|nr:MULTISPECIES: VOC family protein [Kocuria]NKE10610.1 VOC family protein [Kocuria subflava]